MKIEIDRDTVQQAVTWADNHGEQVFFAGGMPSVYGMNEWSRPMRQALAEPVVEPVAWGNMSPGVRDGQRVLYTSKALAEAYDMGGYQSDPLVPLYTEPQQVPQQTPDALHLAAMDLARKQSDRIAELEAEAERFRQHALNEKAARQAIEQQLAALQPTATYQRIGTLYSNSWPMAASGWGFVPSGMKCSMAGYIIEKAVFVQDEK